MSPTEIIPPEVIRAREETHGHRMALWAKTYAIAIADPAMRERAASAADEAVAAFNARFEPAPASVADELARQKREAMYNSTSHAIMAALFSGPQPYTQP